MFDRGLGLTQSQILLIAGICPFVTFPANPLIGNFFFIYRAAPNWYMNFIHNVFEILSHCASGFQTFSLIKGHMIKS